MCPRTHQKDLLLLGLQNYFYVSPSLDRANSDVLRQPGLGAPADQVQRGGAEGDPVSRARKVVRRVPGQVFAEPELRRLPATPQVVDGGRRDPASAMRVRPVLFLHAAAVAQWLTSRLTIKRSWAHLVLGLF